MNETNIEVSIQYNAEDLQRAYALHFKKNHPFRSKIHLILGSLLVLLGTFLMAIEIIAGVWSWWSIVFIGYGILVIIYFFWRSGRMGKAVMKKLVDFHYPFDYIINDHSIKTKGKNSSAETNWEHYQMAIISNEMILLYPNKLRFVLLPKKYFSDSEFSMITTWVKEKVKCR
jgi:hypothetical protein